MNWLKWSSITFIGINLGLGVNRSIEYLALQSKYDALDFAREHKLGGSMLETGKSLVNFHSLAVQESINQGFILGAVFGVFFVGLIAMGIFTSYHKITKTEYLNLKDKASRWDYHQAIHGNYENSSTGTKHHHSVF